MGRDSNRVRRLLHIRLGASLARLNWGCTVLRLTRSSIASVHTAIPAKAGGLGCPECVLLMRGLRGPDEGRMASAPMTASRGKGAAWPVGGGETGALLRAFDWSATPLGRIESWPQSL